MKHVTARDMNELYIPPKGSHKGQNGKLLIIGGSHLFHAASLWALTVASRIVDLVHYSSVPENNELVVKAKEKFRNGIVAPRGEVESYIEEDDCILIGPGMVRPHGLDAPHSTLEVQNTIQIQNLNELSEIQEEGQQTAALTNYLLAKHPNKQWVIDAGALQTLDVAVIPKNAILTPHRREFDGLWNKFHTLNATYQRESILDEERVHLFANEYRCIVLLKGQKDIASNGKEMREIIGGNAGMTKGGTGDVLAGLIAALACKNDPFLAAIAGSFINKKAGDALYSRVGPYFNATDLVNQIPLTMNQLH